MLCLSGITYVVFAMKKAMTKFLMVDEVRGAGTWRAFCTNSYTYLRRGGQTHDRCLRHIPTFLDLSSSFIWRRDLKKVSQKVSCNDFGEAICQNFCTPSKLILSLLQTKLHKTQHPNHQP
jgi:hypothetical protein